MGEVKCTKEMVDNCAFSSWYPKFKSLTIRSEVIPLSQADVDYLRADGGIIMPEGCEAPAFANEERSDDDSDAEDWDHDDTYNTAQAPKLPNLVNQIKRSISSLGGVVIPKLNWSAPRDAAWMSFNGTIRCQTPYDVFLLLKSSDFVTHDLTQPYKDCSDCDDIDEVAKSYEIVLRRYRTIIPGMEFRCFVKKQELVGVCQRDDTAFYDHLREEHKKQEDGGAYPEFVERQRDCLCDEIQRFFAAKISGKFPDEHYVVDIYRRDKDKFWLIDFNPFSPVTDGLLFSWDELATLEPVDAEVPAELEDQACAAICTSDNPPTFEFRINSQKGVQPSPFLSNRLPKDIVDLTSGEDIHKFVDLFETRHLGGTSDGE